MNQSLRNADDNSAKAEKEQVYKDYIEDEIMKMSAIRNNVLDY